MGSLASSINHSINVGLNYYGSRIILGSQSSGFSGIFAVGPQVPGSLASQASTVDGVERAYPTIILSANKDEAPSFSSPTLVLGSPPDEAAKDPYRLEVAKGRRLNGQDRGRVVVGSKLATDKHLSVGDSTTILGQPFEVVGILEYLNSDPDGYYVMNIEDAKQLLLQQSQFVINPDLVTNINVIPKAGVNTTDLANRLQGQLVGTQATPPEKLKAQIKSASQVLNLIVLGSALIAVLVGSLSVINTMLVSVGERRKEIGIKRVAGARNRHLVKEVVIETSLIGLIGGLVGFGVGAALVTALNAGPAKNAGFYFALTPELAAIAIGFSVVLGVIAGLYPAWRAIRIKPVDVLREE